MRKGISIYSESFNSITGIIEENIMRPGEAKSSQLPEEG
jgi:hypothetical protein